MTNVDGHPGIRVLIPSLTLTPGHKYSKNLT